MGMRGNGRQGGGLGICVSKSDLRGWSGAFREVQLGFRRSRRRENRLGSQWLVYESQFRAIFECDWPERAWVGEWSLKFERGE